ncbi:MAG TPA: hypothetical protein VN578_06260 [Candidatus Binatia bacterium]|jgi:hypothetical protein|nr:hypothetical protein [Candidatus Binatia bacterium]
MSLMTIPWLLALATGIWFGFQARKAGRNWLLWGLGGAFFALVVTTILFGLGEAAAIPFSDAEKASLHKKWTAAALIIIAALGWLFTMPLHRSHLAFWNARNKGPATSPPPPVNPRIDTKAETPKSGPAKL